jgi:hypothetical protein
VGDAEVRSEARENCSNVVYTEDCDFEMRAVAGKSNCWRIEYEAVESKIYRRVGNVVKEKDTQGNS